MKMKGIARIYSHMYFITVYLIIKRIAELGGSRFLLGLWEFSATLHSSPVNVAGLLHRAGRMWTWELGAMLSHTSSSALVTTHLPLTVDTLTGSH